MGSSATTSSDCTRHISVIQLIGTSKPTLSSIMDRKNLKNIGNTCFVNSALRILRHTSLIKLIADKKGERIMSCPYASD